MGVDMSQFQDTSIFKDNVILITGGTGSFGNAVLKRFLTTDISEIRIFSRDEKKQDDMRKKFNHPKLKFYLGDVRDFQSVMNACRNVDFIFHAAALKQVPSCEFYPLEAVKTNVLGTENVLEAAIQCGVKRIVCLSTDKAVYPINAMGISKAMMEKVVVAKSRNVGNNTIITATRYGNVMASRGSVIPLFVNQIRQNQPITITDPNMTRFMMTLDDAVDLVIHAFKNGQNGDIFVQKAPASNVGDIAVAIKTLLNKPDHKIKIIGMRHGEKLYESLLSREERFIAFEEGDYFRVKADNRDLNYEKYLSEGNCDLSVIEDYNSDNTIQLNLEQTIDIMLKLEYFQKRLSELDKSKYFEKITE